jgi:regulator of sigma E protease
MIETYVYFILAFIGLGFLIFIHELGHYYMARHVGMKVEAFGIGFGKAIYKWKKDGVEWRWNWLPFGGYVKIAGMEPKKGQDPYAVPGGFFTKKPLDRIKVALAGPLVNLLFAFVAFSLIWAVGGREKTFSEYTSYIGWVDPDSMLYEEGIRPGDQIVAYDGNEYVSSRDHLFAPMIAHETLNVQGFKVDYRTGEKTPFDIAVKPYPHPASLSAEILTSGIIQPASQVIYRPANLTKEQKALIPASQNVGGIKEGDRIIWADGVRIFSQHQLRSVLNDDMVLLTIQRGDETLLRRVPRVAVHELKLDLEVKEELTDWQHESGLAEVPVRDLRYIPYNLTYEAVVENPLDFIDSEMKDEVFPEHPYSDEEKPLEEGDRIVAINGARVDKAFQLFGQLQKKKVNVIVLRDDSLADIIPAGKADTQFEEAVDFKDLNRIAQSIGTGDVTRSAGNLVLLEPIAPKKRADLFATEKERAEYLRQLSDKEREIENLENAEIKERAREQLSIEKNELILGVVGIQDQMVTYNPDPFTMFADVSTEMWNTLKALFSGALSPKWLSGPVGIVQAVQHSWYISISEVLFWLGLISLNLGYLNLLPVPVLDGGYICMFLFEMATGKRIKPQHLERLIIPFFILLILLLLFVTFHDISRLFGI